MVAGIATIVVAGAYVMDHARLLRAVDGVNVTLDRIDRATVADPAAMRLELSSKLGVDVMSYQIRQIDFVSETVRLRVFYHKRPPKRDKVAIAALPRAAE